MTYDCFLFEDYGIWILNKEREWRSRVRMWVDEVIVTEHHHRDDVNNSDDDDRDEDEDEEEEVKEEEPSIPSTYTRGSWIGIEVLPKWKWF